MDAPENHEHLNAAISAVVEILAGIENVRDDPFPERMSVLFVAIARLIVSRAITVNLITAGAGASTDGATAQAKDAVERTLLIAADYLFRFIDANTAPLFAKAMMIREVDFPTRGPIQ